MEIFTLKRVHYNKCITKETHTLPDSRRGSGDSTKYMHHTNNKAIKSQNRNKYTTELLPKPGVGF